MAVPSLKLTAKAPDNRVGPKRKWIIFQPSMFMGELLVSGRVLQNFKLSKFCVDSNFTTQRQATLVDMHDEATAQTIVHASVAVPHFYTSWYPFTAKNRFEILSSLEKMVESAAEWELLIWNISQNTLASRRNWWWICVCVFIFQPEISWSYDTFLLKNTT